MITGMTAELVVDQSFLFVPVNLDDSALIFVAAYTPIGAKPDNATQVRKIEVPGRASSRMESHGSKSD